MTVTTCKVCGEKCLTKTDADRHCEGKKERKTNKAGFYTGNKPVKKD